jgi:hypothetical protein
MKSTEGGTIIGKPLSQMRINKLMEKSSFSDEKKNFVEEFKQPDSPLPLSSDLIEEGRDLLAIGEEM